MRRTGFLFDSICSRDNFLLAWTKAVRGRQRKPETLDWYRDLNPRLDALRSTVADGTFVFGSYDFFTIHAPKERVISAASFQERIVHHALMTVLDPLFERY